ncbi:MAG: hypothetical protein ACFCD0_15285 [Gemmataceae bacterium]
MSKQLPQHIADKLDELADIANDLMDEEDYEGPLKAFREGFEIIPPPKKDWSATLWFLAGIGDAQWFLEDHKNGIDTWRDALVFGGLGNVFVHLRRGQVLYELGELKESANELLRALLLGGEEPFAEEDRKYWDHVTSEAKPPEGWTSWDGWTGVEKEGPVYEWLMDSSVYEFRPKPGEREEE